MKIDAIFFDLGMVLVTFDWDIAIQRFAAHNGGDRERIQQFLAHSRHEAFERNELSSDEFHQFARSMTGADLSAEEYKAIWSEIFQELPQTIPLIRELAKSYPLYTISNTNPWHVEYLERRFDWMNLFTQRFYSCTLGVRKPDPRIFELALAQTHVQPERALFIDDRLENVQGARRVGMQTIHAPTPDVLRVKLLKFFPELQKGLIQDS